MSNHRPELDLPITAEDLAEYVRTQDSFDLELFVYRTAVSIGYSAAHGGTYEDPITQKHRQFDVRATAREANCEVAIALECKSISPHSPLLVSCIPRAPSESYHELIHAYEIDPAHPASLTTHPVRRIRVEETLYPEGEQVGKAMAQVRRNERADIVASDADVFEKWSQALASAHEFGVRAMSAQYTHKVKSFYTAIVPALVVPDETLWAVEYSSMGDMLTPPKQVRELTFFVGRAYTAKKSFTIE